MKPKLYEVLAEGQPTLVNVKFVKKIANGAAMYDCAVNDRAAVHFDSSDNLMNGPIMATKSGKSVVFKPLVPPTPAAPATPATPPPVPPAAPAPIAAAQISLSQAVKVAEYIITRLSQQREVLGDNFASTVNTLLIQCLRNVSIDLSLPPPQEAEQGNDLPF